MSPPTTSAYARDLAVGATGVLAEFNRAGVLHAADVHVAQRCGAMVGETDPTVLLAAAVAVGAVRSGSVCVDLATVEVEVNEYGWAARATV